MSGPRASAAWGREAFLNDQKKNDLKKGTKKRLTGWQLFNVISLGLTALLLWGVVVGNQGVGGLLARWGSLHLRWMIAALACMVSYWLLEAVALHGLIACLYTGVPFACNVRTAMIGQLYSALTPFSSGGQPVQVIYMQRDGLDTGGSASVLVVKSIVYQAGVMVVAFSAILSSYAMFRDRVPAFVPMMAVGFISNLLVTLGMLLLALSPRVTNKLYLGVVKLLHALHLLRDVDAAIEKTRAQFEIYHQSTRRFEKKRGAVLSTLLITFAQLISMYLVPYMIYRAFGYREDRVIHIIAAVAFVSMVAAFVPLPGGSGGAEGSFVLFFAMFFPQNDLLVALLLWRIITYYAGMLIGALIIAITRKRQRACIRLP
jgi:uncharacterized protein (TIRG00374 family)